MKILSDIKTVCMCSFLCLWMYIILGEYPLQREVAKYAYDDDIEVSYSSTSLSYFLNRCVTHTHTHTHTHRVLLLFIFLPLLCRS